jgi:tRNA G37 N-methylase Trm5
MNAIKTVTAKVNLITLNRGADLVFWGENVYVPFGHYTAKALPQAIDALGDDVIVVQYDTVSDPKEREKDRVKFSKRLNSLGTSWTRSDWRNVEIGGYVFPNKMECVLTRNREVL